MTTIKELEKRVRSLEDTITWIKTQITDSRGDERPCPICGKMAYLKEHSGEGDWRWVCSNDKCNWID